MATNKVNEQIEHNKPLITLNVPKKQVIGEPKERKAKPLNPSTQKGKHQLND